MKSILLAFTLVALLFSCKSRESSKNEIKGLEVEPDYYQIIFNRDIGLRFLPSNRPILAIDRLTAVVCWMQADTINNEELVGKNVVIKKLSKYALRSKPVETAEFISFDVRNLENGSLGTEAEFDIYCISSGSPSVLAGGRHKLLGTQLSSGIFGGDGFIQYSHQTKQNTATNSLKAIFNVNGITSVFHKTNP